MNDGAIDEAAFRALRESVGDDAGFISDLIETYLAEAPALLASLRAGLVANDVAAARRAAHTLKSTSASLGALALSEASRAIETLAAHGDVASAAAGVAQLEAKLAAATAALRERSTGVPER